MTGSPPPPPPPGWHPDNGGWRWWDGHQWGEWCPSGAPGSYQRVPNTGVALLAHLGGLLGGFLIPLIVFLTADNQDGFVRRHAAEALNFQITMAIGAIGAFVIAIPLALVTFGIGLLILIPVMLIAVPVSIVFMIQGAIAANRGEEYTYPICVRLVSP